MEETKVYFEKIDESVILPTYATFNDAGMDVRANADYIIAPGETIIVKTGLKVALADDCELQVRPRSGLSLHTPLRLANSPGTIDAGYRDEIGIIIVNTSKDYYIENEQLKPLKKAENTFDITSKNNKQGWYEIKKGDRIAQFVVNKLVKVKLEEIDDVLKIGNNRGGGFGHTGTE